MNDPIPFETTDSQDVFIRELLCRVAPDCRALVDFQGEVSAHAISKLILHLNLMLEIQVAAESKADKAEDDSIDG